jgi:parallel beta-helix repeat protein
MGERNTVKNNYIANNSLGVRIRALDVGSRTEWNIIQSNIIANNSEIGLYLETAIWCRISRNNFIGNTVHASFIYEPFFCYFIQMNTFYRNYWEEDNLTTPKVIQGDILCFFWLAMFNAFLNMVNDRIPMIILPKTMPWKNYDWSPAQEPYDISGMS